MCIAFICFKTLVSLGIVYCEVVIKTDNSKGGKFRTSEDFFKHYQTFDSSFLIVIWESNSLLALQKILDL